MKDSIFHFVFKPLILFLVFTHCIFAQDVPDRSELKIKKKRLEFFSKISTIIDSVKMESYKEEVSIKKFTDTTAQYWITDTFNPYPETAFKKPFKIEFSELTYASPIDRKKVVTSRYGWRWGRAHHGIDIDLISGDDVKAILKGKVRFVGYHGGHGRTIVIRHENGLETVYAHLSRQLVKVNDSIAKGQIIGKGGTSGNARGSHLHLEVLYKGQSIHPEYLFNFKEGNRIHAKEIWVTKKWVSPLRHTSRRKSNVTVYTSLNEAIAAKEDAKQVYIIKKGDTLWKIARKFSLSISQICRLNAIRRQTTLKIGQRLFLN